MKSINRRVFVGSIATETNTFSPLRTDILDFKEAFYAPPGQHPDTPTLCSAVFPVARHHAHEHSWTLIEGTACWAEPGGVINQHTWVFLKEQLLDELRSALPVDIVLLGLHGAMVAQDCLDCEGELLAAVREIVGPDVVVGATLDPHSHLSQRRVDNADILVAFKEFPHTDFVEAAHILVSLVQRTADQEISPHMSVFDCQMIEIFPTSREPMRSFVDRIIAQEGKNDVLSISVIHGFMAGDVPDLGTKTLVITDNAPDKGQTLAQDLGHELYGYRGNTRPEFLTAADAVQQAMAEPNGPIVMADVWDNPGGGVAGDSTLILKECIAQGVSDMAMATLWDPIAVRLCFSAGEGATFPLRFGGKVSQFSGDPIDATVTVRKLVRNATQSFGSSVVPLGDAACICIGGIELILNTARTQVYSPDVFSNMGINPLAKKILVVKSTNHFAAAFTPIAKRVLYIAVDGPYPNNPKTNDYRHLRRALWPRVTDPLGLSDAS